MTDQSRTAMNELLAVHMQNGIVTLTIDRPAVRNALNARVFDELSAALTTIEADAAVRAVILTGAGDRAFAAGADITELGALHDGAEGLHLARLGQSITRRMERLHAPVIAAVNGYALGGGCELALAADIRIASESARFGQPEVNLGLIPGYGGTQRLARLVGRGMAMYLCLSGEPIDAAEALRIGLVQRVVPGAALMDEARRIAELIAAKAPLAITAAKAAIDDGAERRLDDALAIEARHFAGLIDTADFREGTQAFSAKRAPLFRAR